MKVHLRMIGCRLNQSEIEMMARQLERLGHSVVDDPDQADHFVVNTCAVTGEAAADGRKLIRELHRSSPAAEITVTGCYAQIAPDDISVLPGVGRVVGNREKDRLVETITGQPLPPYELEPLERELRPGLLGRTRAFIKVQDGCDNACTFCVTTVARGEGRSRSQAEIVQEISELVAAGVQEAVLTGVHLGSYGHDMGRRDGLAELVQAVLAETELPRLRLSSLEPWDLAEDFFALWQDLRLCRHLHLPLQSGCDKTLRRMARNTDQASFRRLVQSARARIPGLRITTDVIVGFPGETDEEFATSEAFIREMAFAGLHVFRYSMRPGTPAARMRGQVAAAVKKERSARLLALAAEEEARFAQGFVGARLDVLWEQVSGATEAGFINSGYTDNYLRVRCIHPRVLANHITPAVITGYNDGQLEARAVVE